ncbi:MAG TPA: PPOX class F420-dependent oxidoreductase [Gaiellales bacterium]|jgi:PPOX class probable F420-dependent enzyme|nr:PPOX class F420-dependent oxidoreductase [Gaiellales bacterium]
MAISDKARALFATKALGMLGTVSEDGTVQVTPVWIMLDGDTPVFNTVIGNAKERTMRRDPRVTLTIVDPEDVYSYVELRGRVDFQEGPIAIDTIDALARKYIDQDRYPWAKPGDERVTLRLDVEREIGA